MIGKYNFLKVKNGMTYFARVYVDVEPHGAGIEVVDTTSSEANYDQGGVNMNVAPTWVTAALSGAREAGQHLMRLKLAGDGILIKVIMVEGTIQDTTENALHCAAALATCQAVVPDKLILDPYYEVGSTEEIERVGRWQLRLVSSLE